MSQNDYHVDEDGKLWRGPLRPDTSGAPLQWALVKASVADNVDQAVSPARYVYEGEATEPLSYDNAALRERLSSAFYGEYFQPSPIHRGWRLWVIDIRHWLHGGHCWEPEKRCCRICGRRGW